MPPEPRIPSPSLKPIPDEQFGYAQARHLLWRAGLGGTPDQVRLLASWGPEKAVDHLLDYHIIDTYPEPSADAFRNDIMRPYTMEERQAYARARREGDENTLAQLRRRRQQRQGADRSQARDIQRWWLTRMIETPRPLEEKMTLFWHGHFATGYRKVENSYHMYMQNQLFRTHAVGNFGDLLYRIIRDPAMIKYLDNDTNRKNSPNENLSRELMELFALGEGNYTERDIKEGARALTGYTFDHNDFYFNNDQHDQGSKQLLGARGNLDGDDFVSLILQRVDCARFIATKLHRFFVADHEPANPEAARNVRRVVHELAEMLARANYELKPMLRRLFLSQHFYDPAFLRASIKSPVELTVGAIRSLRTPARDLGVLIDAMGRMGQSLLFPPNVAGWSGGRTWINTSTIYVRQNLANYLLTGRTPAGFDASSVLAEYDPTSLLDDLNEVDPGAARDADKVINYLLRLTLGGDPRKRHTATLRDFAQETGGRVTPGIVTGMLALIGAMPEYQLK
jgi:uncharacterized protein (DUF1800 family)